MYRTGLKENSSYSIWKRLRLLLLQGLFLTHKAPVCKWEKMVLLLDGCISATGCPGNRQYFVYGEVVMTSTQSVSLCLALLSPLVKNCVIHKPFCLLNYLLYSRASIPSSETSLSNSKHHLKAKTSNNGINLDCRIY